MKSGAKVNNGKSRSLAVGSWDTSAQIMNIPYCEEVKILGIHFLNTIRDSVDKSCRTMGSNKKSRCVRDFPPVQTGPGAHPASCKMGTVSFPEAKCGRGMLLTNHPLLVPRSWKVRAIPLPTLWSHRACNGITLPLLW